MSRAKEYFENKLRVYDYEVFVGVNRRFGQHRVSVCASAAGLDIFHHLRNFDFSGIALLSDDWRNFDLTRANFSTSTLVGVNLIECKLSGTDFSKSRVVYCRFLSSEIKSCNFQSAVFIATGFQLEAGTKLPPDMKLIGCWILVDANWSEIESSDFPSVIEGCAIESVSGKAIKTLSSAAGKAKSTLRSHGPIPDDQFNPNPSQGESECDVVGLPTFIKLNAPATREEKSRVWDILKKSWFARSCDFESEMHDSSSNSSVYFPFQKLSQEATTLLLFGSDAIARYETEKANESLSELVPSWVWEGLIPLAFSKLKEMLFGDGPLRPPVRLSDELFEEFREFLKLGEWEKEKEGHPRDNRIRGSLAVLEQTSPEVLRLLPGPLLMDIGIWTPIQALVECTCEDFLVRAARSALRFGAEEAGLNEYLVRERERLSPFWKTCESIDEYMDQRAFLAGLWEFTGELPGPELRALIHIGTSPLGRIIWDPGGGVLEIPVSVRNSYRLEIGKASQSVINALAYTVEFIENFEQGGVRSPGS